MEAYTVMTDPTLVRLAQRLIDCRQEYEMWSLQNTWGRTTEELAEIEIGYRTAAKRYLEAQRVYDAALNDVINDQVSKPDA
jgi:hypothetical protein